MPPLHRASSYPGGGSSDDSMEQARRSVIIGIPMVDFPSLSDGAGSLRPCSLHVYVLISRFSVELSARLFMHVHTYIDNSKAFANPPRAGA
jgi:hypothetical protein